MVLPRLNAAIPGFLALVALALTLFATSIGLLQVAGSLTTLPLRGPDVHRNFLFIVFLPRPKTVLMASTTGSTLSKSSNIFISMLFIVSAVSVSALVNVSSVSVCFSKCQRCQCKRCSLVDWILHERSKFRRRRSLCPIFSDHTRSCATRCSGIFSISPQGFFQSFYQP